MNTNNNNTNGTNTKPSKMFHYIVLQLDVHGTVKNTSVVSYTQECQSLAWIGLD